MDIDSILAAEINLAWLRELITNMQDDLLKWIDENDLEDEEYLADVNEKITDAYLGHEQSLTGIINELEGTMRHIR